MLPNEMNEVQDFINFFEQKFLGCPIGHFGGHRSLAEPGGRHRTDRRSLPLRTRTLASGGNQTRSQHWKDSHIRHLVNILIS